jgi:hypothetical protein
MTPAPTPTLPPVQIDQQPPPNIPPQAIIDALKKKKANQARVMSLEEAFPTPGNPLLGN